MNSKKPNQKPSTFQRGESIKNVKKKVQITDDIKQKYFINKPHFDLLYAEDELGFNFDEFSDNGFELFLNSCYCDYYIALRKEYISRNFGKFKDIAHKFKSPFGILSCDYVKKPCEKIQSAIEHGNINVEEDYLKLLEGLNIFLNNFHEFSKKIAIPLNQSSLKKFVELNKKMNSLEDLRIRAILCPDQLNERTLEFVNRAEKEIFDKQTHSACCNSQCIIF